MIGCAFIHIANSASTRRTLNDEFLPPVSCPGSPAIPWTREISCFSKGGHPTSSVVVPRRIAA